MHVHVCPPAFRYSQKMKSAADTLLIAKLKSLITAQQIYTHFAGVILNTRGLAERGPVCIFAEKMYEIQ